MRALYSGPYDSISTYGVSARVDSSARVEHTFICDTHMAGKEQKTTRKASRSRQKAPVQLTGGKGFRYENPVAARFLLDVLTGKNSLGADFARVIRVDWQVRDAGWLADDLAITCQTAGGDERVAGISVKSYQQLTRKGFHPEFSRIVWQQWLNQQTDRHFKRGVDAVVLATSDLANDVQRAWSDLLSQALSAAPERVVDRLKEAKGDGAQSSGIQRAIFNSLRPPDDLSAAQATDLKDRVLLLRDIRVLSKDYDLPSSSDHGQALLDCQSCLASGDASEAVTLWDRLVGIADEKRPVGGSLDLPSLLAMLRNQFRFVDHPDFRADWLILKRRNDEATASIDGKIGGTAELPRGKQLTKIASVLTSNRVCILVGESGSGKSALAKQLLASHYRRRVWLSDELDQKSAMEFERAIGLRHFLVDILLSSPEPCLVVLDGVEAYSSDALRLAAHIIKQLFDNPSAQHIHVLIIVQFEAAASLVRQLVQLRVPDRALDTVTLDRPSSDELNTLLESLPQLSWVALRPEIRPLLTNLKVLDLTAHTLHSEQALGGLALTGLTTLIDILWADWVERGDNKYGRSHLLKMIAIEEADKLASGVARQGLGYPEQQALPSLETSGLVRVKEERVAFTHALLGDWARMRVLVGDNPMTSLTSRDRAKSPRWQKAMRLFGQRILEQAADGTEQWRACVENVPESADASAALMRDLFLESLFLASNAADLLERTWSILVSSKGELLRRLIDRFLYVATLPDSRILALSASEGDVARFEHAFRVPYWPYWGPVLSVLHAHRNDVIEHAPYQGARVCSLWLRTMPFEIAPGHRMLWRAEAAELALAIAREIQTRNEEGPYYSAGADRAVYETALYAAKDLPTEVGQLCLELAKRRPLSTTVSARVEEKRRKRREAQRQQQSERVARKRALPTFPSGRLRSPWPDGPSERVDREFQEACLNGAAFVTLVQANPDVALEVLLAVCIEEPQEEDYGRSRSRLDLGLAHWQDGDPPMYFRGPFLQFLRNAPDQGLTFVLRLVNFATRRAFARGMGVAVEIDGQSKLWLGSSSAFRWHHDWPLLHGAMIHSSLMALERWLYEQIDAGQDVGASIRRIVAESESVVFAGILFDVGKKLPSLFTGALKPLFSAGLLWNWDFQVTNLRLTGQSSGLGYWGGQPQQVIELAQEWYRLPHRRESLLQSDGAIPRTMLSKAEFRAFFEEVRSRWSADLESDTDSESLRLLIERINPDNYIFPPGGADKPIEFQWPEAIARENEKRQQQIDLEQGIVGFPSRCRALLDAGTPLAENQLPLFLQWLQSLDANPPSIPTERDEPLFPAETVILGGIAILVVLHLDWLLEDRSRIEWCRGKLEAISSNPPRPSRFDSEVAIGDSRWDDFAAECGVRLLVAEESDPLARKLVAQGVMAFHYGTTGLTMARAFAVRDRLGDNFGQLTTLVARWAALRVLGPHLRDLFDDTEGESWETRRRALLQDFVDARLPSDVLDLAAISAETLVTHEALEKQRYPELGPVSQRRSRGSGRGETREELFQERLGFDEHALAEGLSWINPDAAQSPKERGDWLQLIHALLRLSLATLPTIDDPEQQEIEGLPSEFDAWVFEIVARAIPRLKPSEHPEALWKSILDLGAPAHEWVERFFWSWFTTGLRAARSPSDFTHIWRAMILHAIESPKWDRSVYWSHRVDVMVIELLGMDARWNALAADAAFAPLVTVMVDVFEQAADLWFRMPRVVRNFLYFVVQPAAVGLLAPAIFWISKAVASFSSYEWRDVSEDTVVEFLRVCWQRERAAILSNTKMHQDFLGLLAIVVARGGHAAIALRDQIAGSGGT